MFLSDFGDETLVNLLLYRNSIYSLEENKEVTKASINFILSSQSFAGALTWLCFGFPLGPADFFERYILHHFILDFHRVGWVKMSAAMVERRRKLKKKHWLKRPKAGPQRTKLGPKYKLFKVSYL